MFLLTLLCLVFIINASRVLQSVAAAGVCCPADQILSITGRAKISVPTNIIRIGFTIETKDLEATNSFSANNKIAAKVNKVLVARNMIPEKNITTTNYQMASKYTNVWNEYNKTYTEVFEGFVVTNQIDVKLTDKLLAASIIDSLVLVGVKKFNYITFDIDADTIHKYKKELAMAAIKDAFDQSKIIASNSNLSIVDVRSVSLADYSFDSGSTSAYGYRTMALAASSEMHTMAGSNAIYTGQQQISVAASFVFTFKQLTR